MAAPLRHALKSPGSSCAFSKPQRLLVTCSSAKAKVKAITSPGTEHITSASPEVVLHPPRLIHNDLARPCFDTTGVRLVGAKGEQNPDPSKAKLGKSESSPTWLGFAPQPMLQMLT